jgi:glyoxylase-like metal-dependent hydrolase (beta-lactamase superfamily II)
MVEKVTTGFYFTNSYIVSNDKKEAIIIDCGLMYGNASKLIKEKYDVKAILITHAHMDHIDGLQYFMDKPIYMTKETEGMIYDSEKSLYDTIERDTPFSKGMLNIINVSDNDIINLIGYDIKVIETPGHTDGSTTFLIGNDMFSGDTIFSNGSYGRYDFPTGNFDLLIKSIKKLLEYDDSIVVYPGHGSITSIGDERKFY